MGRWYGVVGGGVGGCGCLWVFESLGVGGRVAYCEAPMPKQARTSLPPARRKPAGGPGGVVSLSYADSGVDIDAGDEAAGRILSHLRRTHGPRVIDNPGGFAGLFRLDYNESLFKRNYKDPVLVACTDGVGTKVKLAVELGVHDTIGIDCVAMNVNDMLVQGAEPLLFLDYIGIHKVDPVHIERLVKGVADGVTWRVVRFLVARRPRCRTCTPRVITTLRGLLLVLLS